MVELWDDSSLIKPAMLFAAWADGMVVRKVDGNGKATNIAIEANVNIPEHTLAVGFVPPSEISRLLKEIEETRFFRPPSAEGYVFTCGPRQTLSVQRGKQRRRLQHCGSSERFKWLRKEIEELGPQTTPTREDMQAFMEMWDQVIKSCDAVKPKKMTDFKGERELKYPEEYTATDQDGNPSVAFLGIPEHRERICRQGEFSGVTTMTAVQVCSIEDYLKLKTAGEVWLRRRYGDWLYFATGGLATIGEDGPSIGVTYRHKVLMPPGEDEPIELRAEELLPIESEDLKNW